MLKKKGISLIVLVITIIVMIVLAGAIILSLNNSGIIGKANQAVKDMDEATVKELAQMAWGEAYAEGIRHVKTITNEDGIEIKGLEERVREALGKNGVALDKYIITVTDKGVDVRLGWKQEGLKVIRGKEELEIGQTVKYIATGTDYTGQWKVLGADEDGNLLIMSAIDVKSDFRLGYESTATTYEEKLNESQNDWLNGAKELNNECLIYGSGKGAISARSINVEDVNKVTKYVPEKALYGKGTVIQYGNEVTYYYNSSVTPKYTSKVTGLIAANLEKEHTSGFFWYGENNFHKVEPSQLKKTEYDGKILTTIISNVYYYYGTTLTTNSSGAIKGLSEDSEAYKMLFGTNDNKNNYWLASSYVSTGNSYVYFGMRNISNGSVYFRDLWGSTGYGYTSTTRGIRAVVTISSDVSIANLI